MDYRITTRDERETIHVAQNLESEKFKNMVICLQGDLGSGKTIFTKGFAQALGIDENITSPTFNIISKRLIYCQLQAKYCLFSYHHLSPGKQECHNR